LRYLIVAVIVLASCTTPAILDPHDVPGRCHQYTEHACGDGTCCLNDYVCGGPQPGTPTTCAADKCCYEGDPINLSARKPMKKRKP
jgi:hypothetical protein